MRSTLLLATAALGAVASAQPARIAWTRSSSSADIVQDTVRDGAFLPNGHFVVVGGSKQLDGTMKGCITIFNRNRAVVKVREYARPGGGSMEFRHVVVTPTQFIAVGGNGAGTIAVENDETHTVGHDFLMEEEGIIYYFSAAAGKEEVTDIALDPSGALVMAGYRTQGTAHHAFLARQAVAGVGTPTNIPLSQTAILPGFRPEVTVNGIIAILIGLLNPQSQPIMQGYSAGGALNWSMGASNPTSVGQANAIKLEDYLISGYLYAATSWTSDLGGGLFSSQGRIHKFDATTGAEVSFGDTPGLNGGDMIRARDTASGQATGKRVNALFDFGGSARVFSFNADLGATSMWDYHQACTRATDLAIDPYSELVVSLCNNEVIQGTFSFGYKLNQAGQTRYSWGMSQLGGFMLPYMEQSNIIDPSSGDIVTLRSDNTKMQLVKVEQAPVGVTDSYQPKSGRFFRPNLPVTHNDRYAGGATITITQQPAHGTLSMGANGIFNYTSAQGYVGGDMFKYRLTKPGLNTSTVTVNLNVKL